MEPRQPSPRVCGEKVPIETGKTKDMFGPRRPPFLSDALDAVFSRPDFLVEILQGSVLTGSPLKRFFSHPRLDK